MHLDLLVMIEVAYYNEDFSKYQNYMYILLYIYIYIGSIVFEKSHNRYLSSVSLSNYLIKKIIKFSEIN